MSAPRRLFCFACGVSVADFFSSFTFPCEKWLRGLVPQKKTVGDNTAERLGTRLGQFDKAHEAYADAATRYSILSTQHPGHYLEVARTHQAVGGLHEQSQNVEAAIAKYQAELESIRLAP